MKQVIISILVFCATGTLSLNAQEIVLSLDRTIEMATDSSLQAFTAKNVYLSKYWEFRTFKAARLPSLTLNMTPIQYDRRFIQRYDSENNMDVFRQQQSLFSSGFLSVQQNVDWTGGTFFVDTELNYRRNFSDQIYSQFSSAPIRFGYFQKLFGFNEFKWQKKIEPLKYEKAKKKLLYDIQQISEESTLHFFDLAMAQAEYDLALDNVSSSDTLYRIGQERFNIMSISKSELLTLKLDAINAKNSLKNAEIQRKRVMSELASFLNMDQDTPIRTELSLRPGNLLVDAGQALEYARENNPDFMEFKQSVLEAEQEVEKTRKSSNFEANIRASVGFNQVANNFSDAYKSPLQEDIVSIDLIIPLVDWGVRKGKANMAKNNLNVTEFSVRQKEISLVQDIVMTVNDFNVQQDLISSAEEALSIANEAYDATKQRFIIGKADINSLTLSLNRQKEAQKNYITALKNYWQNYYKIRKLTLFDYEKGAPLDMEYERIYGI